MSNEDNSISYNINNPYYSFHQDHIHTISSSPQGFEFPITTTSHNNYNHFHDLYNNHHRHNQQPPPPPLRNPNSDNRIDHSSSDSIMSFSNFLQVEVAAEYNALSNAFDLSCSSSHDQVAAINYDNNHNSNNDDQLLINIAASAENPRTPNSSVSFSSQEAGLEDDYSKSDLQQKVCEQGDHDHAKSDNLKAKKKEVKNKKERQVRFAFMTKSEVDNLEDGYRWRKYGQKAVKNSPFPRSYYRCTSQKCSVKKRIERSFEDPSMVITTYEGQHNHHSPATIRGSAAALLGFSPPFQYTNYIFPQDNHMFFPSTNNPENHTIGNSTYNMTNLISGEQLDHHQ
ncbi:hypothetical protein ACP275_13G053600 [Erythranthe tilingii]